MKSPSNIRDIAARIVKEREEFLSKVDMITKETRLFANEVANAIGNIRIIEAEQGIIDYFKEGMTK